MAKRVTLILSDDDHAILTEAARLAGRESHEFAREETMSLANQIVGQGSIKGVPMARNRDLESQSFIDAFRRSRDKAGPIADWVAKQRPKSEPVTDGTVHLVVDQGSTAPPPGIGPGGKS